MLLGVVGCDTGDTTSGETNGNGNSPSAASSPTRPDGATGGAPTLAPNDAALLVAAAKGDSNAVRTQLDKGANVNVKDQRDSTPLMEAVWAGHRDVATLLIEKGADINASKGDGTTVLSIAKGKKNQGLIDLLQRAGAK